MLRTSLFSLLLPALLFSAVRFTNGLILKNHELKKGDLWIEDGKIVDPKEKATQVIDLKGLIAAPGYIDIQINGAFGIDFSSEPSRIEEAAKLLPRFGVTSFLPTLVTLDREKYLEIIPRLQPRKTAGASILGIHLEGPFFNPKQRGAHNEKKISAWNNGQPVETFFGSLKGVRIVTLAPETPGALRIIGELKEKGIIASLGHTNATYDEALEAIQTGAKLATHLFNAMTPFHHRNPGIAGAVLSQDSLFYSVILDGHHIHPASAALAWRASPKGLILISDAIEALGLPPGPCRLGNMDVEVKEGKAFLKGTETLAGSILSLDQAVRNLKAFTGCSPADALEAASLKPAQLLGIEKTKGTLAPGADADFLLLDSNLHIQAVYIGGSLAWSQ